MAAPTTDACETEVCPDCHGYGEVHLRTRSGSVRLESCVRCSGLGAVWPGAARWNTARTSAEIVDPTDPVLDQVASRRS